jgi:transcriptional regulator with XRE-family HTH domain
LEKSPKDVGASTIRENGTETVVIFGHEPAMLHSIDNGDGISPRLGLNQHTHEQRSCSRKSRFARAPRKVELEPVHRMRIENDNENSQDEERNARRANPIDVHVGSRVRLRRMLLGMSQEKLGEQLGLTFQQVQKYEKGVNRIGASRLFDMARVLGVPVQFFFDEVPGDPGLPVPGLTDGPASPYLSEILGTREGLELNKAYARISDPRVRRAIVELVRSLAGDETLE